MDTSNPPLQLSALFEGPEDLSSDHTCVYFEEVFDPDVYAKLILEPGLSTAFKNRLKKWHHLATRGNHIRVSYDLHKEVRALQLGRLYPVQALSLVNFDSDVRNALAGPLVHDADMENAHPVLLHQVAMKMGWECPALTEYVMDREGTLKSVAERMHASEWTKQDVKEQMRILLYLGNLPPGHSAAPFLKRFRTDVGSLAVKVAEELPDMFDKVKKRKSLKITEHDVKCAMPASKFHASMLSMLLGTIERNVMLAGIRHLEGIGRAVAALVFDGMMIVRKEGEEVCPPQLLRDVEGAILDKTGFSIKLVQKPMVTSFTFDMLAPLPLIDDLLAAHTLLDLIGEGRCYRCNEQLYFFNEANGMFEEDDKAHTKFQALASKFKAELLLKGEDVNGKAVTVNYGGSSVHTSLMRQKFAGEVETRDDLFSNGLDSSNSKLLFTNGMLDMATGEFTTEFDPKYIFKDSIGRPFVPREEVAHLIPTWRKKLFVEAFSPAERDPTPQQIEEATHVTDFLIKLLGRGLAGEYLDKRAAMILGRTNSCKGTITDAITAAAGGYVGSFNMSSLCSATFVNPDAKSLSFIVQFCYKRLAFGNESPDGDVMSGYLIRSIVSGGDAITVRTNRVDEYQVRQRCALFMMANDMPVIKPYTETEDGRLHFIQCTSQFAANPDPTKPYQKQADPHIKRVIKTDVDVMNAVLWIIIDGYQASLQEGMAVPSLCMEAKKEWTQSLSFQEQLEAGGYKITLDDEDEEPISGLYHFMTKDERGPKLNISSRAFAGELQDLKLKPVLSGPRRTRHYTGIKFAPEF